MNCEQTNTELCRNSVLIVCQFISNCELINIELQSFENQHVIQLINLHGYAKVFSKVWVGKFMTKTANGRFLDEPSEQVLLPLHPRNKSGVNVKEA